MSEPADQYVAFISYSHKDAAWAKWVQRELERYRLPAAFAKEKGLPKRLGKIFRDREELSTGQNLGDHLTAALDHSQNLIVICSPNAVQSQWVSKEIEYFKNLGRGDRIFALLVEGGAESLPAPLLTDVHGNALEPLAADPRKDADGKRLAKLKLIAGMLETNLDQLAQRERARRQKLLLGYAGLANVFLIAVGAALYFEQERQNEAEQKALERELGIENVMSMTDFVKRTRQYYDKGALEYVSNEFSKYLVRFDNTELTRYQRVAKADALRVVGEATYDLGDVEKSLQAYSDSRELYHQASSENRADIDLAIEAAFADFYVGVTHFYEGNLAAAKQPLEHYARQISALYEANPDHPVLIQESIAAPTAVLTLLVESSDVMSSALRIQIDKVNAAVEAAIELSPDDTEILFLAQSPMDYAADAHMKSCEVFNALRYQQRAVEYARKAVELDPRNRDYQTHLANALFAYAQMRLLLREPSKAVQNYTDALTIQAELLNNDPDNQYLLSRKRQTLTELLATLTFHPEVISEMRTTDYTAALSLQRSTGLSPTLDMYLIDRAVANNDGQLAQLALNSLEKMLGDQEPTTESVQLAVTLKGLSERALGTTFVSNLIPADVDSLESCNGRLIKWAKHELEGNYDRADSILEDAKAQGLSGMALGFYSDLLRNRRR
jgi:tetratricopeptide (TPR) repeat protein